MYLISECEIVAITQKVEMSSILRPELLTESEVSEIMTTIMAELRARERRLPGKDYVRINNELKEVRLIKTADNFERFLSEVVDKVVEGIEKQDYSVGILSGQVIGESVDYTSRYQPYSQLHHNHNHGSRLRP